MFGVDGNLLKVASAALTEAGREAAAPGSQNAYPLHDLKGLHVCL